LFGEYTTRLAFYAFIRHDDEFIYIYIYTTLGNYSDLLDRKRNAHAFVPKLEMI